MQMTSLIRPICLIFLLTLCRPGLAAPEALFPRPAELEPDVSFWVAIFTDYSSDQGVLHDNRYLGVVYGQVRMPGNTGRRERQRKVQARRKQYQAILGTLADGKRDHLSAEEQRILQLWPTDVSNDTLRGAVKRIRYQQGLSDRFRDGLKRAGRWRDHVHTELAKHGVPLELAALPHVESSYNPDARSHVGASGIWQFTPSTGRRYLQVDHVLDERNDPFAATEAAARLLAYNYSIADNWPMAITAYNHGLSGVRRAMRKHGDTAYAEIFREYRGRTFGFASRNFYVAFLAAMQIDQNPEQYFPGIVPDQPVDYSRYKLPDYMPSDVVATALGTSERQLARHNPALQATIWQGSKYLPRDFEIRMPAGMLQSPMPELLAAVPPEQRHSSQLPDMYHAISRGDTLSEIATQYGTTVTTLVALNGLGSRHRIRAGQQLRLPAAGPAPAVVAAASVEPAPTVVVAASVEPVPTVVVAAAVEPAPLPEAVPPPAMVTVASVEPARLPEAVPPPTAAVADAPALPEIGATESETGGALADDLGATILGVIQASLLSDPSDYTVAENHTIEVQPLETLGHFADWLGIKTQRLRDLNGLAFRTPVTVGQRIKLDFGNVEAANFENLRLAYHRQQQDAFFRNNTITGVTEHVIRRGESVWILSLRQYKVPVWLFRQYNPELDPHNVQPGTRIEFPVLVANQQS